ncbi:hypothetical protein SCHPADRAFT_907538 [Schizopora paradoxa]|uniref:Uncharacterized protein n=1 Tax=Schizopora paradoxa TaxID=27342 RepID=A0A0H2RCX9_9AGAM|nr:hypothetical protein SCHPADRAFT_907538 [Schizopora paradoxa]
MDTKQMLDYRAAQSEDTRTRNFNKVKDLLTNLGKSQKMSKAKLESVEPPALAPLQTVLAPNYDGSSSHTPMDEGSQSSFLIRLPPKREGHNEQTDKETKSIHRPRQNALDIELNERDAPKRPDDASTKHAKKSTSRKASTSSSRRSSGFAEAVEERLTKKFEERIAEVQAQESAHREFFESRIEEMVCERTESLKEALYREMDELQWALMRSEEDKRTLQQNQIRMVAVIDEMQNQLQELRYELGYGTTDPDWTTLPKRGALCMELYPDHYATLNPIEGSKGKCRNGKNRERCVGKGKKSAEKRHIPPKIISNVAYDPKDFPQTTGKADDDKTPLSRHFEPVEKSKKRSRDEVSPVQETGECSNAPQQSASTSRGSRDGGRSTKRPRQSKDDPVMKQ